ncbi:MAG: ABC transporter substrate-binding protein [Motilibacteraceae bacterium]
MPGPSAIPRRRKGRLALAGAAALGALSLTLTACGGGGSTGNAASSAGGTLKVLIHDNKPTNAAWQAVGAAFEKANPGTKVEFSFIPTENFPKVRTARLTAGDVDVTEGNSAGGTRETPDYAKGVEDSDWVRGLKAGQWTELSGDYLNNWSPGARKDEQFNGKDYAVPTAASYVNGVYYNQDLFAKYNVQVPKTWDDFVKALDTFKANGVTPIVMGGAEKWPVGLVMEGIVDSAVPDMSALDKALWTGEAKFSDPAQIDVLNKIQKIYSYAPKTFPGSTDAAASALFASGKAAMFPEGTWQQPSLAQANANLKFSMFPLPGSNDAANNILRGKLENNIAIPSNAKHKDLAQKFIAFYSKPDVYQTWVSSAGVLPVQPNIKSTAFLDSMAQYLGPNGFSPTWGQVFHPNPTAPKAIRVGFPYDEIAPMGTQSDMGALATSNQKDWSASLPKG